MSLNERFFLMLFGFMLVTGSWLFLAPIGHRSFMDLLLFSVGVLTLVWLVTSL
jgi:hypothetical protein